MHKNFQKMLAVFKMDPFDFAAKIFLNYDKNTCDSLSMC